jgi:hypothetical protein
LPRENRAAPSNRFAPAHCNAIAASGRRIPRGAVLAVIIAPPAAGIPKRKVILT